MDIQQQREQARMFLGLFVDNGGVIRTKAFPARFLEDRLHTGIGWTLAQQALTPFDIPVSLPELGAVGEFRQQLDLDTLCLIPAFEGMACLMSDLCDLEGQPWAACPRSFLKRVLQRFQEHGLRVQIGVEHEFLLLRQQPDGSFLPADNSLLASPDRLYAHADFLSALLADLESQGLEPCLCFGEYGPGQIEIATSPQEALWAADHICQFRELVRARATTQHLLASFAPKPFPAWNAGGSGAHIHISVWQQSAGESTNVFYDPQSTGQLSQAGRSFIAGVLEHLEGLLALTCASVNSYHRLQPQSWSSAYTIWGYDNREAAIRVPSTFWGKESASLNLELRCADHSANPYLALGGVLAAGLEGMLRQLEVADPVQYDPAEGSEEERRRRGIRRLPVSLDAALAALEQDTVLCEALGQLLCTSYLAVKREEIAYCRELARGVQGTEADKASAIAQAYLARF
ncbi:glutamine synthetase [Ktedonosporobacter rubrisoli]|uniref:Glutamine synthetase n=1 Tax=Ktedonosporobacter rubrisoli TaxID=2509675 RepID=A0A4V0YY54_KTERU|nr:glutamine synthetase family protein [Ktedonosporobacter rubrisoli]QBD75031.1 glutamine synthetase [Ktedonosporobacter rubrisoli]